METVISHGLSVWDETSPTISLPLEIAQMRVLKVILSKSIRFYPSGLLFTEANVFILWQLYIISKLSYC